MMTTHLLLTCVIALAAGDEDLFQANVRTTEPLAAEEQLKLFHVPPGFEVQLVAAEPELQKPMNLAFDGQGRVWVSGSIEYPYAAAGTGRDAIKVLDGFNDAGRATRVTTFADGLNIPIGLYPYREGVVAYSISQLEYFGDTDGDGRAEQRNVLYGPLDRPVDTHGMQNAFRRGADGWLYVNHGFANQTTVRGSDGSQISMHSGNVYRVRLDGSRVEQYTWGQVNPFGSDWTADGDLVTADCHSKPLTLLLPGGYYQSFGKPDDGLGFAPELMNHHHRSTGLAGVAYYGGGTWPAEYERNLFLCNVVTSRVHRDLLAFDGATAKAVEQPDFVTCDDPWFRPVDVRFGPDGALYIADFYNRIIGHYEVPLEHPGRDRHRGRVWRVVYRGTSESPLRVVAPNLATAPLGELIEALANPQSVVQQMAADQLSDRMGEAAIASLRPLAQATTDAAGSASQRLWARWVLFRLQALTLSELYSALADESQLARMHGLRLAGEMPTYDEQLSQLLIHHLQHADANVRRVAATALGRHPASSQVAPLLHLAADAHERDPALHHSTQIALRNHLQQADVMQFVRQHSWTPDESRDLARISRAVKTPAAAELILDYLQQAKLPVDELGGLLRHVARYLPAHRAAEIPQIARRHAGDDPELSVSLLRAARQNAVTGTASSTAELTQWGAELVARMTSVLSQAENDWRVAGDDQAWGFESRRCAAGSDITFLSSLPGGEQSRSVLISRPFTLPDRLSFDLCGHRGNPATVAVPPGDQASLTDVVQGDCYVALRLLEPNRVVRRAYPPRNDVAQRVDWDLQEFAGQVATIELVDQLNDVAYAWLAVAEFEPAVVSLPTHDPRILSRWQQLSAELIADLPLADQRERLALWARDGWSWDSRAAAARSLSQLANQPVGQVAAELIVDRTLLSAHRSALAAAVADGDLAAIDELLRRTFQQVPQARQELLARQLAASQDGAKLLVEAIEAGAASGLLLQRPRVREMVLVAADADLDERVQRILATVPPEDVQLQRLIDETTRGFVAPAGPPERGAQVFAKTCSACHQAKGQGTVVGPQLDGIGNRGLQRVAEDLLAPYRNVDAAFRTTIIALKDGRVVAGWVRDRTDDRWVVVNSEGKTVEVDPRAIEESHVSPQSIMPDNFGQTLTQDERTDLLAFLLQLR